MELLLQKAAKHTRPDRLTQSAMREGGEREAGNMGEEEELGVWSE